MKFRTTLRMFALSLVLFLPGCSNDDPLKGKTELLVDIQWFNAAVVGTPPSGYTVYSPLVFRADNKINFGGSVMEWRFIDQGNSIELGGSGGAIKFQISTLTESEFQFKQFDIAGNLIVELKYDKCNRLTGTTSCP